MKKIATIIAISLLAFSCVEDDTSSNNLCQKPVGLEIYGLTNTTVTLNWQSPVETSSFDIMYGSFGFALGEGIAATSTQSSYNLSGLTPLTHYEYYVNLSCDESNNFSDWAGPFDFTTLDSNPFCEDPTDFQIRNSNNAIGSDFIDLIWANVDNDGSQLQYGLQGFALGNGTIQSEGDNINNGFGTVENLDSSTVYDFYVRNNCQENGFSAWIGPVTATTTQ